MRVNIDPIYIHNRGVITTTRYYKHNFRIRNLKVQALFIYFVNFIRTNFQLIIKSICFV